jgi:hypothetical protein
MCGPAAIAVAAVVVIGVVKSVAEQDAQNDANEYNARIAERNKQVAEMQAVQAEQRGELEEANHRRKVSLLKGRQRASFGGSGALVDEGSPLDVALDTIETEEIDALNIQFNTKNEVFGHKERAVGFSSQAALARSQKKSPLLAGVGGGLSAFAGSGSLLSGK